MASWPAACHRRKNKREEEETSLSPSLSLSLSFSFTLMAVLMYISYGRTLHLPPSLFLMRIFRGPSALSTVVHGGMRWNIMESWKWTKEGRKEGRRDDHHDHPKSCPLLLPFPPSSFRECCRCRLYTFPLLPSLTHSAPSFQMTIRAFDANFYLGAWLTDRPPAAAAAPPIYRRPSSCRTPDIVPLALPPTTCTTSLDNLSCFQG